MKKDGFIFKPYKYGGWQCKLPDGTSIRTGSASLFIDKDHPYEVWYVGDDCPEGYQTAEDIHSRLLHA